MNEIVFVVAELLKQFAQIEINKTEQGKNNGNVNMCLTI